MPELSATEVQQVCNEASRRGWLVAITQPTNLFMATFMQPETTESFTRTGRSQRAALATAAEALRLSWQDEDEEPRSMFEHADYRAAGATAAGSGSGIQFTMEDMEDIMRQCGEFMGKQNT